MKEQAVKGMELARGYYEAYGRDMIAQTVPPEAAARLTIGLAGEGSQCFGFDDAISRDHDFAPGFCIWMEEDDYARWGAALQQAYDSLPPSFLGCSRENIIAGDRLGVMTTGSFYSRFTGNPDGPPASNLDWLFTSEVQLAAVTNGQIFAEGSGRFTAIRNQLLEFYPADVLRKKIAARAAVMSQAGQYNLMRVLRRGDGVAALLALARFMEAALSMVYLLNRKYMPFYKWAFHGLTGLPLLAAEISPLLREASGEIPLLVNAGRLDEAGRKAFDLTEAVCHETAAELRRQGFSAVQDDFLQNHLADIMGGIQDPQLRAMPPMFDCGN